MTPAAIETARAQLMPQLPLFLERLAELTQSSNETIRLLSRAAPGQFTADGVQVADRHLLTTARVEEGPSAKRRAHDSAARAARHRS
jgi:hypothetical protein